ncbi:glutamate receptor ionotropic, kainate 2-like [Phymastichus coffea]|uniref:glutamate receptor ionotropic, kainate 2-like n=1 Tax=Phymastichus coffea TaxID=108790 RepID=UPI00273AE1D7|nr:glutamate receptor ionotropic, kainate 2-like [Phymastichus coffea]
MLVTCVNEDIPIREWYSLFSDKIETFDYATWSNKKGFQLLSSKHMYERRPSLKGITLRVTYVKDEVYEGNKTLPGFFRELLNITSQFANFTIQLQEPQDVYGIYNNMTGQWNGLIGQLVNNKSDVGLGFITITTKRLDDVDFAIPLQSLRCCYFVKKLDQVLPKSIYYKSFGKRASYVLTSIYFLAPFVITCMLYKHREARFYKRDPWRVVKTLHENFILVWGILCKMPLTKMTKISSLRLAYLSLYILSLLLSSIYSANLTSSLTNFKSDLPFYSVKDFIQDGTYKLMAVDGTSLLEQIEDTKDENFNKLREKNMLLDQKKFPKSTEMALQQLCDDEKLALFDDTYCKHPERAPIPCRIVPFDESYLSSVSIAFVKNSPYVKFFNFWIQKLQSSGILQRIHNRNSRQSGVNGTDGHSVVGISSRAVSMLFQNIDFKAIGCTRKSSITKAMPPSFTR